VIQNVWPVLLGDGPSPVRVVLVCVLLYLGVTGIFALNRHLKRPPD
jgi:hypothetical protein